MFEHHSEAVAPLATFLRRLVTSSSLGLGLLAVALAIGMGGFRAIEGMSWIDSYLNACMLLGGMGPLEHPRSPAGKLFEGTYAVFCGLAVLSVAGIVFAPVVHRFLHRLHQHDRR